MNLVLEIPVLLLKPFIKTPKAMLISVKQKLSQNSPALRVVTSFSRKINSEPQYCSWDFKLQYMRFWSEISDFTGSNALLLMGTLREQGL